MLVICGGRERASLETMQSPSLMTLLPALLVLLICSASTAVTTSSISQTRLFGPLPRPRTLGRSPGSGFSSRSRTPLLRNDEADIGSTWFTALDSKDDDFVLSDGTLMIPGDDVVEPELKRIFSVDSKNGTFASDEIDELKLMYKLRKELGDADFRKIFDDPRVRGADMF